MGYLPSRNGSKWLCNRDLMEYQWGYQWEYQWEFIYQIYVIWYGGPPVSSNMAGRAGNSMGESSASHVAIFEYQRVRKKTCVSTTKICKNGRVARKTVAIFGQTHTLITNLSKYKSTLLVNACKAIASHPQLYHVYGWYKQWKCGWFTIASFTSIILSIWIYLGQSQWLTLR